MTHGYSIVDGNGIEFSRKAAHFFYFGFYLLTNIMQMYMSGYKLCKRIYNGNQGFAHLFVFHSVGTPQRSCPGHTASHGAC